jgi:hypothetical protein
MDQYSAAELSELFLQGASFIELQFQFWIWITFATIVAAFVAGERLTPALRYVIAALYVLAVITLYRRSVFMGAAIAPIAEHLQQSEATIFPLFSLDMFVTRTMLWIVGTVAAVYFLLTSGGRKKHTTES